MCSGSESVWYVNHTRLVPSTMKQRWWNLLMFVWEKGSGSSHARCYITQDWILKSTVSWFFSLWLLSSLRKASVCFPLHQDSTCSEVLTIISFVHVVMRLLTCKPGIYISDIFKCPQDRYSRSLIKCLQEISAWKVMVNSTAVGHNIFRIPYEFILAMFVLDSLLYQSVYLFSLRKYL